MKHVIDLPAEERALYWDHVQEIARRVTIELHAEELISDISAETEDKVFAALVRAGVPKRSAEQAAKLLETP